MARQPHLDLKFILDSVYCFFILDILSLAAYTIPLVSWLLLPFFCIGVWLLISYDRRWLLLLPLAELMWGSFGLGFSWQMGPFTLSIRMLLLIIALVFFGFHFRRELRPVMKGGFSQTMLYAALWTLVVGGFTSGLMHGNDWRSIFFDGNGYHYILYVPLWLSVFNRENFEKFFSLFTAAAIAVSLKTLVLFNLFANSYKLFNVPYLYLWLRDSRFGEFTPLGGAVWRIFMQSQIFIAVGVVALAVMVLYGMKMNRARFGVGVLMLAALMISFSRSFWLGTAAAIGVSFIATLSMRRAAFATVFKSFFIVIASSCAALILVTVLVVIPYGGTGIATGFSQRIAGFGSDPAGQTRLQQLQPLAEKIREHPLFGSGFGTTVTFASRDPRSIHAQNPEGLRTTYAFEWGYLDQTLKWGILGVLVFMFIIFSQFYFGWRRVKEVPDDELPVMILLAGLLCIMIVHVTSPYLNHPLGLGYLSLVMVVLWDTKK